MNLSTGVEKKLNIAKVSGQRERKRNMATIQRLQAAWNLINVMCFIVPTTCTAHESQNTAQQHKRLTYKCIYPFHS